MVNPFVWFINNTFWRLVFWWKKRTGWLDLKETIVVEGEVIMVDKNIGSLTDGDVCFNVLIDRKDESHMRYVTGFGGRFTTESETDPRPAIHCEITPWDRGKFDGTWQRLTVGQHVRVTGSWGFDGVHTGRPEWLEVLYALWRHQPNVRDGWFEIHPVQKLEILDG